MAPRVESGSVVLAIGSLALVVGSTVLSGCMTPPPPDQERGFRSNPDEEEDSLSTPTLRRTRELERESPRRLTGDSRAGCDDVPEDGECDGDILVTCNTSFGLPSRRNCDELGGECVEDRLDGAHCEGSDGRELRPRTVARRDTSSGDDPRETDEQIPGCGSVTEEGSCGGTNRNTATFCQITEDGGEVVEWDCDLTGAVCEVDGCIEGSFCCDAGSRTPSGTSTESCDSDEFECSPGACIPDDWVCDGTIQCDYESVRSDEEDCPDQTCLSGNRPCDNGSCIPTEWFCDETEDCSDGSDEQNCGSSTMTEPDLDPGSDDTGGDDTRGACSAGEFECSPGACIPEDWVCDGTIHCDNESVRSDEENCPNQMCLPGNRPCGNGSCVPESWWCDGSSECGNGADEADCS